MSDEFNELYDMLSTDREEIKKIKENYEKDIAILLGRVRSYQVNDINIKSDYDVDNDFSKYHVDNIFVNYNLNNDMIEYKIALLQGYLSELFVEKKFYDFKRMQEQKLSKNEYLEYVNNAQVKSDKISAWYQEFMNK